MPARSAQAPIVLYRHVLSGHSHRVELFLSILNLPFVMVEVDLRRGEQKGAEFLAKNPFGQVPVIEDGQARLADSNAILTYLALKYAKQPWLPQDPEGAAAVQLFLSVSANQLVRGPAVARLVHVFGANRDLGAAQATAHALFKVLDAYLIQREFLAATVPTIADLANYTYIAHAPEGGVSLDGYPRIRAWLRRIEALPGFVPMQASCVSLGASRRVT